MGQQVVRIGAVAGIERYAHRRGKRDGHAADRQRFEQRADHRLGDPCGLLGAAIIENEDEPVPAHPAHHVGARGLRQQALAHRLEQPVSHRQAIGVVDVLEAIEVEAEARDVLLALWIGGQRLLQPSAHEHPIGQAGERIVIGQPPDLGPCVVALDGHDAEVKTGFNQMQMPRARPAPLGKIEGKGSRHTSVAHHHGIGPARLVAERQDQRLVVGPERVGFDILDHHRLAAPGGRAATAGSRPDLLAVDGPCHPLGHTGRGQRAQPLVLVDAQDRDHGSRGQRLDLAAHAIHEIGERDVAAERIEQVMLEHLQTLGLGNVGQHGDEMGEIAVRIVDRIDLGRHPDRLARLRPQQQIVVKALPGLGALARALMQAFVGHRPGQQRPGPLIGKVVQRVAEQFGKGGIDIAGMSVGVRNEDCPVGPRDCKLDEIEPAWIVHQTVAGISTFVHDANPGSFSPDKTAFPPSRRRV